MVCVWTARLVMSQLADDPTVSGGDQEGIRRFLTLVIAYSLSLILAAVGFAFYVVLPLWIWFAHSSTKFDSSSSLRNAVRLLIVIIILWIAFTVPLFFFLILFAPLVYAAEVSAILIGSFVMYLAAGPFAVGDSRNARARRTGVAAAIATAANLGIFGVLVFFRLGMTTIVGGEPVVYVLSYLTGLVASVRSAVSFIGIAVRARKRIRQPMAPENV